MSKLVYLGGPITGCSYDGATDWRDYTTKKLNAVGIDAISPMRAKYYLERESEIKSGYEGLPLSAGKGVVSRDRWDVQRCDVVMLNLLDTTHVSIGSMIEIGWADAARKPIILCLQDKNIHDHAMVTAIAGFVVPTLDEGITLAKCLLL